MACKPAISIVTASMNIDKFFKVFGALAESNTFVIVLTTSSEGIGNNVAIHKCNHQLDSTDGVAKRAMNASLAFGAQILPQCIACSFIVLKTSQRLQI
jgi:hypothetical protein